jgi:hypothetical protein
MGSSKPRTRAVGAALLVVVAMAVATLPSTAAKKAEEGGPPVAEVLATVDLAGALQWYYRTDLGILLAYAGDRLYRIDLLAEKPTAAEPLAFPGLDEERSVLPVARTGLLLVPHTAVGGKPPASFAIDTLSGEVRWEAEALPGIDVVFSFPDAGLAVLRSPDDGGRLIAIDLLTGKRVWQMDRWAWLAWTDAPYLRAVVGESLLTLDVHTGETVREDDLKLPKAKRITVYDEEDVIVLRDGKRFTGFSIPPIPPAPAAPPRELWTFEAASMMIGACVKAGNCYKRRVGDDLLLVVSARKNELFRLTTGQRIALVKKGMFSTPVTVSPSGRYMAAAASDNVRIHDGATGELLHEIAYPKGGEGMKTLRYMSWPSDEMVMTVFPDKKGNPRKMMGHSCADGTLAWTAVLPEVADYKLTSQQRARLVGRIMSSLIMTAVSASNPVHAGGDAYFAVFVPNLNVSESLAPGLGSSASGQTGGEAPFATSLERYAECERLITAASGKMRYFVTGAKGRFEVLKIDLVSGEIEPVNRYQAATVHAIAPFIAFERAVSLEDDNRRLKVLALD